jgi:hypothetical protein
MESVKGDRSKFILPFGKWEGYRLDSIPLEYLDMIQDFGWVRDNHPESFAAIREYLQQPEIVNELRAIGRA